MTDTELLALLDKLGLGCQPGCSCRGEYTGPERRKAPRSSEHRPDVVKPTGHDSHLTAFELAQGRGDRAS